MLLLCLVIDSETSRMLLSLAISQLIRACIKFQYYENIVEYLTISHSHIFGLKPGIIIFCQGQLDTSLRHTAAIRPVENTEELTFYIEFDKIALRTLEHFTISHEI